MIQGIDVNKRIEFISKEDLSEPKTIFVFRPLTGSEMIDLGTSVDGGNIKLSGQAIIDFIDKSLVEVKNFSDLPKRQVLDSLSPSILAELVNTVSEINNITDKDKKK